MADDAKDEARASARSLEHTINFHDRSLRNPPLPPSPIELLSVGVTVPFDQALRFEDVYCEHGERLWRSVVLYAGDREIASEHLATGRRERARWPAGR